MTFWTRWTFRLLVAFGLWCCGFGALSSISRYRFRNFGTLRSISQRRFRFLVVFLVISLLRNWKYEIELKCGDLRPDTATRVLQFDFTCADFSYSTS